MKLKFNLITIISIFIGTYFLFHTMPANAFDSEKLKIELKKRLQEEAEKRKIQKSQKVSISGANGIALEKPSLTCDASLKTKICYAFTGPNNSAKNKIKGNEMACKMLRGKIAKDSICPTTHAIGKCQILSGTPDEYFLYYYSGGKINSTGAQKDCLDPKSGLHRAGAGLWQNL